MTNLVTQIHYFYFNIDKPDQAAAYQELCDNMKAQGIECFETWGGGSHYDSDLGNGGGVVSHPVTIETKHMFGEQWNTAPIGKDEKGRRVHNWAMNYHSRSMGTNERIKMGHYLTVTPEMTRLVTEILKCGYCGHQHVDGEFCPDCIGSEYLTEDTLHLTRLKPVKFNGKREPLTDDERTERMKLFTVAQTEGEATRMGQRLAKYRAKLKTEKDARINNAKTEFEAFTWLMDNGLAKIAMDNCIFYQHTGRFCFGWKGNGLSNTVKNAILEKISEFPFEYDIKTADGKTYSSGA